MLDAMRLLALPVLVGALLLAAASPVWAHAAATAGSPCRGSALRGTFRVMVGSAGAGNIVYELRLRNASTATCFVSGIPGLTLLSAGGRPLPTHPSFSGRRGMLTAVLVTLAPSRSAKLSARFSPDVPGPGEPQTSACEPKAFGLRVMPNGGGSLVAAVSPPTPVCEHGGLQVSVLTAA